MGKAKGKKGRRQQDSSDDDDFVDPIQAALAAGGGDDAAVAAPAKKAPKKKKGRQAKGAAAAAEDDDAPAAPPPPPPPARKQKKGGRFRGDSSEDEAPAPAPADDAPKKLSRAQLRKQKLAKKAGRAEPEPEPEPAAPPPPPEEDDDEEEEEEVEVAAPAPRRKKDKKAARRAAAMAAMLADEPSEDEEEDDDEAETVAEETVVEEPQVKTKKKMSKAERRRAKAAPGAEAEDAVAAPAPAPAVAAAPPKKLFGGGKKTDAFAAAMAAAEERDEDNGDADQLKASLDKYRKKLKKASAEDAAKYEAKIAKYEKKLEALDEAKKRKAADADKDVDTDAALAAQGGLLGGDDAWRDDSNDHHGRGPRVEATFEACLANAVRANDGQALSSKARRKLEKDYASRKRAAEAYAAKEQASLEGAQFACSQSAIDENDAAWLNALDVKIDSFTISAAGKTLFENSSLLIAHGRRYGIVGPNGRGKTTLLKMIASGDLRVPPRVQCLYVEQEVQADDTTAVDAVLKADVERTALMAEEVSLTKKLETLAGAAQAEATDRLRVVGEELKAIGASAADAKARRILFGLGFSPEMQVRATKLFSGGWRMRISLARALFMEPILLMLDEPTNHLDLNAVIWLDDYLQKYKHTILVVSHDQDFLNSVCDETLHISEQRTLDHYRGNYDTFKALERQKRNQQQKAWEKQEKQLKALKGKGGNSKKKAEELMKNSRSKREPKDKKKQQAIASGQASADVTTLIERPKEYAVEMEFPPVPRLAPPVLQVIDAQFRYAPQLPLIFTDMNFGIDQDSRICVVGNNGSGKTTLLNLLTGKLQCTDGDVKRNPKLRIGVYNQHFVERLPMDESPVDYLRRLFEDETYQSIRNMLGRYGLQGHAHTIAMRDLSGGQKARVVLCELSLAAPHMLLLDEPTNNLDIETIDALCDAINGYDGGVICVTHDARLIEATNMRLWVVEDRMVVEWGEPFDAYRDHLLEKLEKAMNDAESRVTAAGVSVDMGGNRGSIMAATAWRRAPRPRTSTGTRHVTRRGAAARPAGGDVQSPPRPPHGASRLVKRRREKPSSRGLQEWPSSGTRTICGPAGRSCSRPCCPAANRSPR